jgi:hypothetical protein
MNLFFENLNHLVLGIFQWLKFDHIFMSPYELQIYFIFNSFVPKAYVFESFIWVIIHLDFVGFF